MRAWRACRAQARSAVSAPPSVLFRSFLYLLSEKSEVRNDGERAPDDDFAQGSRLVEFDGGPYGDGRKSSRVQCDAILIADLVIEDSRVGIDHRRARTSNQSQFTG